jgi:hypothetical protein
MQSSVQNPVPKTGQPPPAFSMKPATAAETAVVDGAWSPVGLRRHFEFTARLSRLFRHKRMKTFLELFQPTPQTRILDLGGLPRFWQGVPMPAQVTIVNLQPLPPYEAQFLTPNQTFVTGDATALEWADEEFDLVFSNSVIEHLGTWENQVAFARECRRLGKGYWVQTPAREFPVEPHYITLCLHWFPKNVQRRLLRYFSVWGWLARPRPEAVEATLGELRLLTRREFTALFPDRRILTERTLGMPKSYMACKLPG